MDYLFPVSIYPIANFDTALTVSPSSVASGEFVSTPSLNPLRPSGVPSSEAFGSIRLSLNVHAVSIGLSGAVGIPNLGGLLLPLTIISGESFGFVNVRSRVTVGGIATAVTVNSPTILRSLSPSSLDPSSTFGPVKLDQKANALGVSSGEAFGVPVVAKNSIFPDGVESAVSVGSPNLVKNAIAISSIAAGSLGTPQINQRVFPASVIAGSVSSPVMARKFVGGGTIYLGSIGAMSPRVTLRFAKTFAWNINATVQHRKRFEWNVGKLPLYWFRVLGKCQPVSCPTSPVHAPQACDSYTIQMVLARTPQEVCEKLKKSGRFWKIAEMGRFSTPFDHSVAVQQAAAGFIDLKCNVLVSVPACNYVECIEFCVSGEGQSDWGVQFYAVQPIYTLRGSGGFRMGGVAKISDSPNVFRGSGGITISGSGVALSSYFKPVLGAGVGLIVSGVAVVKCSHLRYAGTGGIKMGGTAAVISNQYTAAGTGGMILSGVGVTELQLRFESRGVGDVGPSFAGIRVSGQANLRAFYNYKAAGSGGMTLGGNAATMSSHFSYAATGGVILRGSAASKSHQYTVQGAGGIVVGGSAVVFTKHVLRGSGGVTVSGHASVGMNLSYVGSGGITLAGSGRLANRSVGSGGFVMGGSARVTSAWRGVSESNWVGEMSSESLEPVFATVISPRVSLAASTINQCGCEGLPLKLRLAHNFGNCDILSSFLNRNSLRLPPLIDLTYRRLIEGWQGNYHFLGKADEATKEKWDFSITWGCIKEAFGVLNSPLFKLGVYILRRNTVTLQDSDSRIVVLFNTSKLCQTFKRDGVNLSLKINTQRKTVAVEDLAANVESVTVSDGIGLFRSPSWRANPILKLKLQELGAIPTEARYDIAPIFPKQKEFELV